MLRSPEIRTIAPKSLVGTGLSMSAGNDRTFELWRSFMPRLREIGNRVDVDLICLQRFDPGLDWSEFNSETVFEKWAGAEVAGDQEVPEGLERFSIEGGLYAVFVHIGRPETFNFADIFSGWLPASGYETDERAHFQVMGAKYKPESPECEEEIWVPVRKKK